MMFDRREFLRVLAGSAGALLTRWQPLLAASRVRLSDQPFTLGVASGDPSPDGFVLWTKLAPRPLEPDSGLPPDVIPVAWEVAWDEGFRNVIRRGVAYANPQLGHSVHVEVRGLQPDRWYWYRFRAGDYDSSVGRARTVPARHAEPASLRFAFASCQHFEHGLYTAYEHMIRERPDLIVHLGDYIYEYGGQEGRIRKHRGKELTTLTDYRLRYCQYRLDPALQQAHAACPWLVVWDDHEFDNNYAGFVSEEPVVDPARFAERRAAAYQAYYEFMPLRRRSLPRGPFMKLYRTVDFGSLARFYLLDTRQYRTDQPNGDGLKPLTEEVFDPQATLLGPRQERWLMRQLLGSHSRWNVLAQQVMMARVDRKPGHEKLFSMDQWAGYDVARKRLLRFLAERRVPGPVVITGDIHSHWCNELRVHFDDPASPTVAWEFVGTSISSGGNGVAEPPDKAGILAENPFVRFYNAQRGYVFCAVKPGEWLTRYRTVPYVDRPGAPLETPFEIALEPNLRAEERS